MPTCPQCGLPVSYEGAPCGVCAARRMMQDQPTHITAQPRSRPPHQGLLERTRTAVAETIEAFRVALVETDEAAAAVVTFGLNVAVGAVSVAGELCLGIGRCLRTCWWWFVLRGERWERTGFALGLCAAFFLPAGVYAGAASLGMKLGYPWWCGVGAIGILLTLIGRWVGREHDRASAGAPPEEDRAPGVAPFLCDSCARDWDRSCSRPERPNAATCPDYRSR